MKDWSVQWLEERREDIRKLEDVYDTINYHVYKYLLRRYAPETKIRNLSKEEIIRRGSELLESNKEGIMFYNIMKNCDRKLKELKEKEILKFPLSDGRLEHVSSVPEF